MQNRVGGVIKLFDCRSYANGPFSTFLCAFETIQERLQAAGIDEQRARTLSQVRDTLFWPLRLNAKSLLSSMAPALRAIQ